MFDATFANAFLGMLQLLITGAMLGVILGYIAYSFEDPMARKFRLGLITKDGYDLYLQACKREHLAEKARKRQSRWEKFFRLTYRLVSSKTSVTDMKVGEMGYTVPWSVSPSPDGDATLIRGSFDVVPQPFGTSNMLVRRSRRGFHVVYRDAADRSAQAWAHYAVREFDLLPVLA
jgi:hypothetical protein